MKAIAAMGVTASCYRLFATGKQLIKPSPMLCPNIHSLI